MRMVRGTVEDFDEALDLEKMARITDRVREVFEDENLTANEALWASALTYLATYNDTDEFADSDQLGAAARALLKEATDVFDSLPDLNAPEGEEQPEEGEEGEADGATTIADN